MHPSVRRPVRQSVLWAALLVVLCISSWVPAAKERSTGPQRKSYALAMDAKTIASAVFLSGRTVKDVIRRDLKRDPAFDWWEGIEVKVDPRRQRVTLSAPGVASRSAVFHASQGATIVPEGEDELHFQPVAVAPRVDRRARRPWTTAIAAHPAALERALDGAFADETFDTRALVVVHRGRIVGERYGPGFHRDQPLVGWSMGKSIACALIGVLVADGTLRLDQPAPLAEWRKPADPRGAITIANLLHMSSGLAFTRLPPSEKTWKNDHFLVYFGAIDVLRHVLAKPLEVKPGQRWAYRNCDPLALGGILRRTARARGKNPLSFPQRALFDRIGITTFVLEPDPWGNFILTGYDYGSARDWARFGLLHVQGGVWEGQRILPQGWVATVSAPAPASKDRGYGALFWLNRGGRHPNWPADAFWAAGHAGQRVVMIPSRQVVIVRLGLSPNEARFEQAFDSVVRDLLAALEG